MIFNKFLKSKLYSGKLCFYWCNRFSSIYNCQTRSKCSFLGKIFCSKNRKKYSQNLLKIFCGKLCFYNGTYFPQTTIFRQDFSNFKFSVSGKIFYIKSPSKNIFIIYLKTCKNYVFIVKTYFPQSTILRQDFKNSNSVFRWKSFLLKGKKQD